MIATSIDIVYEPKVKVITGIVSLSQELAVSKRFDSSVHAGIEYNIQAVTVTPDVSDVSQPESACGATDDAIGFIGFNNFLSLYLPKNLIHFTLHLASKLLIIECCGKDVKHDYNY